MTELDIVIVNWNGGALIADCLDALIPQQGDKVQNKVIVVDNQSTDGSREALRQRGGVTPVFNSANEGFGRACNQGAKQGQAEYILFLNPDTAVPRDVFPAVLNFMNDASEQKTAVCGIRLVDAAGHTSRCCARFPNLRRLMMNSLGLDRISLFQKYGVIMREWDHLETRRVDHVIGAFYFMRRVVFEKIGGFDEDFFVYFEDVDLSRRIKSAGYEIVYHNDFVAQHIGGGTTEKVKALRNFLSMRSRYLYSKKHLQGLRHMVYVPTLAVVEPIIRLLAAIARKSDVQEEWKAARLFWKWLFLNRQNPRWMP